MSGEQLNTLKAERRLVLDGGLNTRAGVFLDPSQATALQNFRIGKETGSLVKRKGGSRLCLVPPLALPADLPAPQVTGGGTLGTLAAGTYKVKYVLGTIHGGKVGVSAESAPVVIGTATGRIVVKIPTINSGDGAGSLSTILLGVQYGATDDPLNSGYVNSSNTKVYVDKDGGGFKLQSAFSFTFTVEVLAPFQSRYQLTVTSYDAAGAAAPALTDAIPFRGLAWHPGLDMTIGWIADRALWFSGAHTSPNYMSLALDSAAVAYGFSRLPTRISTTNLNNVMIATDGVGKPKKLHCAFSAGVGTPDSFRQVGAQAPAAAPTAANAGAGNVTGTVQYRVTFNYSVTRPDGTTIVTESNGSPALSYAVGGNQIVTVTKPANAESGIVSWNVYRSVASGTSVFLISTGALAIDIGTTTFSDNVLDANLLRSFAPPDGPGSIGNDPPPNYTDLQNGALHYITEHVQRLFAAKVQWVFDASSRILRLRGTNTIYMTKDGSFDAWPASFAVQCGSFAPITFLKSFRGVLYVFKQDEIGVIEGRDDFTFEYRTIYTGGGAMENSVVEAKDTLYCFDQSLTAIRISGYTVEPVAEDEIQVQWSNPITLTSSGEAATGGGRGEALVLNTIWDPSNAEVRWVISDYITDYTVVSQTSYVMRAYEYVMAVRGQADGRFTVFTGSVSGSTKDRRIMASCRSIIGTNAIYQARDVLYGDYHGRLVRDDMVEYDLSPSVVDISLSAAWPIFFGDNPEAVKAFRYMYVLILMGATVTDALSFYTSSLEKGVTTAAQLMKAFAGGSLDNRMLRMDGLSTADGTNTSVHGLLLTVVGAAQSGPLTLRELSARMTSGADGRNAP